MARIDTPRLEAFYITFFNQIVFNTPKTMQFISHTPSLGARVEARLAFGNEVAEAARIESSINHTIWEASGARTQAVSCSMLI